MSSSHSGSDKPPSWLIGSQNPSTFPSSKDKYNKSSSSSSSLSMEGNQNPMDLPSSNYSSNMNLSDEPLPTTSIRSIQDINIVDVLYQLQYYISHLQSEHESCQLNKMTFITQSNNQLATISKLQDENNFLKRRISMLEATLSYKGLVDPHLLSKPELLLPSVTSKGSEVDEEPGGTLYRLKNCLFGYLKKMKEIDELPYPIEKLRSPLNTVESSLGCDVNSNDLASNYWSNMNGSFPEPSSGFEEKSKIQASKLSHFGQVPFENTIKETAVDSKTRHLEDQNRLDAIGVMEPDNYWKTSLTAHPEAEDEDDLCDIDAAELDQPLEESHSTLKNIPATYKTSSGLSPTLGMMSGNIAETSVLKAKVLDDTHSTVPHKASIPMKDSNATSPFLKILKKDESSSSNSISKEPSSLPKKTNLPIAAEVSSNSSVPGLQESISRSQPREKKLVGHLLPIEKTITKYDNDGNPIVAVTISSDGLIKVWNMVTEPNVEHLQPLITLRKHSVPLKNVAFVPSQDESQLSRTGNDIGGPSRIDRMEFIVLDIDGFCSHWKLTDISMLSPYSPFDPTYLQNFCPIQDLNPIYANLLSDSNS